MNCFVSLCIGCASVSTFRLNIVCCCANASIKSWDGFEKYLNAPDSSDLTLTS